MKNVFFTLSSIPFILTLVFYKISILFTICLFHGNSSLPKTFPIKSAKYCITISPVFRYNYRRCHGMHGILASVGMGETVQAIIRLMADNSQNC